MQFYGHGIDGKYPIIFDHNAHLHFDKYIDFSRRIVLIVDRNVPEKFYQQFASCLIYKLDISEAMKNYEIVGNIISFLMKEKINRDDIIVSIGGGITSDIVGFLTSIYKRGVNWINIPTTVLAMCDATVGGKTAINFNGYKNMIGTINFPQMVIIDLTVLKTLNERQIYNGLCEALKMGLTLDKEIIYLLSDYKKNMSKIIKKCIRAKDKIVKKDYFDTNLRHVLNFGHTIGHAYEMLAEKENIDILHGEAVLFGMRYMVSDEVLPIIDNYIKQFKINFDHKFSHKQLIKQVMNDKKNAFEKIGIVYLTSINNYEIRYIDEIKLQQILEGRTR